jgi:hypothetical protein
VATIAAALLSAAGAGCGASNSPARRPASPPSASAAATSRASNVSNGPGVAPVPNRLRGTAQYVAFASAVNLGLRDVPGFRVKPPEHAAKVHNAAFEDPSAYKHCLPFASEAKPIYKKHSQEFQQDGRLRFITVSSEVEVGRSTAAEDADFARGLRALNSPATTACMARAFDTLGTRASTTQIDGHKVRITVGNLRLAPMHLRDKPSGTTRDEGFSMSLGVDYVFDVRGRELSFPATISFDALTFGVGRAQVTLSTGRARGPAVLAHGLAGALRARSLSRSRGLAGPPAVSRSSPPPRTARRLPAPGPGTTAARSPLAPAASAPRRGR